MSPAEPAAEPVAVPFIAPLSLDDAPPSVLAVYALLVRIFNGHGGRVDPIELGAGLGGRALSTTLRVELAGGNPVLVSVTEP